MAFAAYLQENAISVSWVGGTFAHFLSPATVKFSYEPPHPAMGHLLLHQKKITYALQMPKGGERWGIGTIGID